VAKAGLSIADLELEEAEVEKYILDAMVHLDEPGTLGD